MPRVPGMKPGVGVIGRPPKYSNCMDMEAMCQLYFEDADEKGWPYNITDLAVFLGYCDRHAISEIESRGNHLSAVLKKARSTIEGQRVRGMIDGKSQVVGSIFYLKNAHGYVDKQEVVEDRTVRVVFDAPWLASAGPNQASIDGQEQGIIDAAFEPVVVTLPEGNSYASDSTNDDESNT